MAKHLPTLIFSLLAALAAFLAFGSSQGFDNVVTVLTLGTLVAVYVRGQS